MDILKDIPSETAQQLLNTVRSKTDSPTFTLLQDLDQYILENREVGSSAGSPLSRGDVIEIQGPAASGKTQLLYHLAASCILPKEVLILTDDTQVENHPEQKVDVGGWNKSVVVLDCDGRWDIRRLQDIIVTRLERLFSRSQLPLKPLKPHTTVPSIALQSLSRLHLFQPTSSLELVATLLNLPKYHAEQMPKEEIKFLFVDSISAFHWEDRWQAELSGSRMGNPLRQVLRCLQDLRASHAPITVLTNWGLVPSPATPFYKQHLSSPFPAPFDDPPRRSFPEQHDVLPIDFHITLPFPFVPPLPSALSHGSVDLYEVLQDKSRRELVDKGEIEGYVRMPRYGRHNFGRFRFRVLDHEVAMDS